MTESASLRVLIADDHPLFRDGLACRIQERPELTLIGEAGNGHDAISLIGALTPDVAVLEVWSGLRPDPATCTATLASYRPRHSPPRLSDAYYPPCRTRRST